MKAAPSMHRVLTAAALLPLSICPLVAQTTRSELEKKVAEEQRVTLTPFEVRDEKDTGFAASSSLAGGRISTALKDTPVAYSVLTAEFLDAFNITNVAEAANWSVNTNFTMADGTAYGFGGNAEAGAIRVRGVSVNAPSRNFFPYNVTSDSFNIDRVDFARGANAVLFGSGGAGGTQNTGTKQATTARDFQTVRLQVGSWNKYRATADINHRLSDKVAMRTNLLWSTQDSWRDRLWEDKQGFHVAGIYKVHPKFTVRGEFEYLSVKKTTAVHQFRDFVSAWDGATYDFAAPLTGAGAPSAATLGRMGIARTPQRFVTYQDYGDQVMNFQNRFRTTGLQHNATAPNYFRGQPIRTVGWTVRAQSMIDGNTGIPDAVRYATALGGSRFFAIPSREDTPLWSDPDHKYPVNAQKSRDLALYFTYTPFKGMFIELAGDTNEGLGKGDTAQRRGMQEFYIDLMQTLPNGQPNPRFLETYQERGHYKQQRDSFRDSVRLQSVYVRDTRIGRLQAGFMGGISIDKVRNRSSELMLPLTWISPDARSWINNGELNEFMVWTRAYTRDTHRPQDPAWSGRPRPVTVIDPVAGVTRQVTPVWMWDARREDNVYDSTRNSKYLQFAGNFDLFKNRLVLIGAFRRDFTDFSQNRIKAPGDHPVGWDGISLQLREAAPKDYDELMYFPKDAQGRVTGPAIPADTRPRINEQGAAVPLPQYANDRFRDDYDSPDVKRIVNTHTIGGVVNVTRWLGVYANVATTYSFGTANQNVWNRFLPPTASEGKDAGLRLTLPGNRLAVNLGWYHAYQEGALVTIGDNFLTAYNAIGDAGPVGDLTGRNIRNFARFRTNNIASTQTNDTRGLELEITANLMPNWRLIANVATSDASAKNANLDLVEYFKYADPIVRQILSDAGVLIDPATNQAFINPAVDDPTKINQSRVQAAANGWNTLVNTTIPAVTARTGQKVAVLQSVPWTANLATDYRFRQGPFQGLRLGVGVNLRGPQVVGNRGADTIRNPNNPTQRIDDPRYDATSWVRAKGYYSGTGTVSYTWRIKNPRRYVPRSIQFDLAIENLFGRKAPIYGFTSTGGQNTNGTNLVPNDGTLDDPSSYSVPGNFFYLNPRNFSLSATMNF
ncbi:MAG: TonB-dependent receptor plug domain-containing protein [Opitutaceae bacterium]|nr:TonB-dependent receptor plug domain-containing protein [Opitutaceae bacterium]